MSAQPAEDARLKSFVDSVANLRGISYVAASSEGLPYFIAGIEKENADYVSAVANSLYDRMSELTNKLGLGDTDSIKVFLNDTTRLYVFKYKDLVLVIKYDFALDRILEKFTEMLKAAKSVICYNCKTDLTFKIYRCPKCGSFNTYDSERCWSCGADLKLKTCPSCGKLILPDGSKPGFFTVLIYRLKSIFSK
ncbi:hypothetical protein IPA_08220 [Ignicoccus pacificus DSM 13166]|uniref:DZANK-type domain-containing protein n=1 Tax=Ignicoccus pacificus DSM 13166 TaxID=940294 RepID=A0A977PLY4_9CREN|nr:hypothetical protein IPA_08220 [Ignicoccus pacificus DSM 13166]